MTLLVFWHVVGQWHVHQDGYWQHVEADHGSDCYARARSSAKAFQASQKAVSGTLRLIPGADGKHEFARCILRRFYRPLSFSTRGRNSASKRRQEKAGAMASAWDPEWVRLVLRVVCRCASTLASVVVRNSMMTKPRASWTLLSARCTSPQTPKASTPFLPPTAQSGSVKPQTLNPTYLFLRAGNKNPTV